jgi:hypothetical protein
MHSFLCITYLWCNQIGWNLQTPCLCLLVYRQVLSTRWYHRFHIPQLCTDSASRKNLLQHINWALSITLWTLKKCCQKFDIWYNSASTRKCYILPMMDIPSTGRWVKQVSPIKHVSLRPSRPEMCNLVDLVTPNRLFLGLILCLSNGSYLPLTLLQLHRIIFT